MSWSYYAPKGGLPPQSPRLPSRALFTEAFAYIPRDVLTDIVTSFFPGWDKTRAWIIAKPISGFAQTFAQYLMEIDIGGGGEMRDFDARTEEEAIFVLNGTGVLSIGEDRYQLRAGSFAYVPPNLRWRLDQTGEERLSLSLVRKTYEPAERLATPDLIVTHDQDVTPSDMPDCNGAWATTRFMDPEDLKHDMHMTIVTFQPGGVIPFDETHVMEHGLYMLQGQGIYRVNQVELEVQAGDFLWLRAFCPQSCIATGDEPFRYLLYKDVNRHPKLDI